LAGCAAESSPGAAVGGVGVGIEPASATVGPGGTVQFTGTVSGTINTSIVWSVAEASACGAVSQGALYSAPPAENVCHVVATSAADPAKSATATVNVVATPPAGITISPSSAVVARGGTQQFTVSPPAAVTWSVASSPLPAAAPVFPVRASADGRYLVDQAGRPFFLVGDAAQSAAAALTLAEFQAYLDDRVSRGFNTVNINVAEHYYAPSYPGNAALTGKVPQNRSGDFPFLKNTSGSTYDGTRGTADLSTPNDAYFAHVEALVAYAASKNVLVSLQLYAGTGDHHEGWFAELSSQASTPVCTGFGTYLASGAGGAFQGFRGHPNVIWHWGGDWLFAEPSTEFTRFKAIADGLRAAGATQLAYGDWNLGISTQQVGFRPLMTMQAIYTYASMYTTARAGYQYAPAAASGDGRALPGIPGFLMETGYEGENWTGAGDPASIRKYHWWSLLSGATSGLIFGHRDIWNFAHGATYNSGFGLSYGRWQDALGSTGSRDMTRLAGLFASLPWWRLVPSELSGMRRLVPSANGTQSGAPANYVAAAADPAGSLALAFVPSNGTAAQTFTFDLRQMAGPALARWWNPTTGAFVAIGTLANSAAAQSFTTPGNNGAGSNDWALVLEAADASCGAISATGLYTAPASPPAGAACRVEAALVSDPTVQAQAPVTLP
jgi:hypothetical protein